MMFIDIHSGTFSLQGACFLALVAHHLSSFETTFTAGLLMHFVFAIMVSNVSLNSFFSYGQHFKLQLLFRSINKSLIFCTPSMKTLSREITEGFETPGMPHKTTEIPRSNRKSLVIFKAQYSHRLL